MFYRKFVQPIEYKPALDEFRRYSTQVPGVLLESADIAPIYGRKSLFCVNPIVEVKDHHGHPQLTVLHPAGEVVLQQLTQPVTHLRQLFEQIQTDDPYFGLYGAFSYDYVRQFENLPVKHAIGNVSDYQLYLPDLVFIYDHLKETAELHYYQLTNLTLAERLQQLPIETQSLTFSVGELTPNLNQEEYGQLVDQAQEFMKIGDIFELVLSRQFSGTFTGSPLGLYAQYRAVNPAPYMFFVRFSERTLLAASPEMLVRVEQNANGREVMTRPISGTAARSQDAIVDYEAMLNLLNSSKEKSELDMLIDLARNDLARVCEPGIQVSDYRFVEKYSKVMHTIAQVTGQLDTERFIAFDALVACLNAGTLTGAPKIRAMELIETLEPCRRGYYGGCVGYLTFNNELNTGITIRSAVVEDGIVTTQAGATILLDSEPSAEFAETEQKAAALLGTLRQSI